MPKLLLIFDIAVNCYEHIDISFVELIQQVSILGAAETDLWHCPCFMFVEKMYDTLGKTFVDNNDHLRQPDDARLLLLRSGGYA